MKKLLPVLLLLCIAFLLAACAGKPAALTDETTQSATQADATQADATQADATQADATQSAAEPEGSGSAEPAETADQTAPSAPPEETAAQDAQTAPAGEATEPRTAETVEEILAPAAVTPVWADAWEGDIANLAACTVTEDAQAAFVLRTDQTVTDFEVLSLYEPEFTEDGGLRFSFRSAYSHGVLMPEAPLLVHAAFYGDIPNIGIRYTDTDGSVRLYAVNISGMDGSLFLTEFENGGVG